MRRTNGAMIWYVLKSSDGGFFGYQYGLSTDYTAPGDYDGDGKIELDSTKRALVMYEVDQVGLDRLDLAVLDAIVNKFNGGPVGVSTVLAMIASLAFICCSISALVGSGNKSYSFVIRY